MEKFACKVKEILEEKLFLFKELKNAVKETCFVISEAIIYLYLN